MAIIECGHDVCLDIGRGCRFVGSARLCPHPSALRDVYRNNGRLFTFCRACDSDLSFHDLRSDSSSYTTHEQDTKD